MNVWLFSLMLFASLHPIYTERIYTFKVRVAWFSLFGANTTTSDPLYFRLCHNTLCSVFTSIPNGLQSTNTTYQWNVTAPIDDGLPMNQIQIVHTGDDPLCLHWVDVDDITYYAPYSSWCWESNGHLNVCSTLTITSTNEWNDSLTDPCEYPSLFNDTYNPINPTQTPTSNPTVLAIDPQSVHPPAIYVQEQVDIETQSYWMWIGITFTVLFICVLIMFVMHCHRNNKRKLHNENNSKDPNVAPQDRTNTVHYLPVLHDPDYEHKRDKTNSHSVLLQRINDVESKMDLLISTVRGGLPFTTPSSPLRTKTHVECLSKSISELRISIAALEISKTMGSVDVNETIQLDRNDIETLYSKMNCLDSVMHSSFTKQLFVMNQKEMETEKDGILDVIHETNDCMKMLELSFKEFQITSQHNLSSEYNGLCIETTKREDEDCEWSVFGSQLDDDSTYLYEWSDSHLDHWMKEYMEQSIRNETFHEWLKTKGY